MRSAWLVVVVAACGGGGGGGGGSRPAPEQPGSLGAAAPAPAPAPANAEYEKLRRAKPDDGLTDMERGLIEELNALRTDPAGYAKHLRTYRGYFQGNVVWLPGAEAGLRTQEGVPAVDEAIRVLERTKPMGALTHAPGMSKAARDHVRDLARTGSVSHQGSDGSWPDGRLARYGTVIGTSGENLQFGAATARDVVINLVIDDGVPSRGHRKNMLEPAYRVVGVACERHPQYRVVCAQELAEGFR